MKETASTNRVAKTASPLKQTILASAVLSVPIILLLWRSIAYGEVLLPADILCQFYPWKTAIACNALQRVHNPLLSDSVLAYYPDQAFLVDNLRSGHVPLWNPTMFSGFAFTVTLIAYVSSPASIAFAMLPTAQALAVAAGIGLFLEGLFMYLLLRYLRLGFAASLLGSMVLMLNGNTITWLSFPNHLSTELWAPLVLLATLKAFDEGSLKWAATAGLLFGVELLNPNIQFSTYIAMSIIACALWASIAGLRSRRLLRVTTILVLIAAVSFLVSLPMLSQVYGMIQESIRAAQSRLFGYPLYYLPTYLVPDLYGNPATGGFWGPTGNYVEIVRYIGVAPLILVVVAIVFGRAIRRTHRHYDYFVLVSALFLLVAAGDASPLFPILSRFPFLYWGPPTRAMAVVNLAFAVLAAMAFDLIKEISQDSTKRRHLQITLSAFALVSVPAIYALSLPIYQRVAGIAKPPLDHAVVQFTQLEFQELWKFAIFLLSGLAILWLISRPEARRSLNRRTIFCGVFLSLVLVDLLVFASPFNTFTSPSLVYPETPSTTFLENDPEIFRVLAIGGVFFPNSMSTYGLQNAAGYNTLLSARYPKLLRLVPGFQMAPNGFVTFSTYGESKVLDLLNIKYVVSAPGSLIRSDKLRLVYSGDVLIYQRMTYLPRVLVVHQASCTNSSMRTLELLQHPRFNPSSTVIIETHETCPLSTVFQDSDQTSNAHILSYGPNTVMIHVSTKSTGLLVLLDAYSEDWKAYVDGTPVALYIADYMFRAVPVPAGEHVVQFTYEPLMLFTTISLSIATILVLVALITRVDRRVRKLLRRDTDAGT